MKIFTSFGLLVAIAILSYASNSSSENTRVSPDCQFNGIALQGKVKVVDNFPDIKVKRVDHFPDLKVKRVDHFPDSCGKWKFVDHFPDFKIKYVDHFEDIKIKWVDHFPGRP